MKTAAYSQTKELFLIILLGGLAAHTMAAPIGTVIGWGLNNNGQISVPSNAYSIKMIAAGDYHSLALKADGRVLAWGWNSSGQIVVPGLSNVVSIAAGAKHSLALKADGTVTGWGDNSFAQRDPPGNLLNVTAIASSYYHSLALKADGRVAAWGMTSTYAPPPPGLTEVMAIASGSSHDLALLSNRTVVAWGLSNSNGITVVPANLSNVIAIAAGDFHSLALREDGSVAAWGRNDLGQTSVPAGLSNVVAIAAGYGHSLAVRADGSVVTWGDDFYGQSEAPTLYSNAIVVAAGEYHSLAVFAGPVQITSEPQNQAVQVNDNASFSVTASGLAPLSYQWFFNSQALADGPQVSGSRTPALSVSNVQATNGGAYSVTVSNPFGRVTVSAVLAVLSPPVIVQQPQDQSVPVNSNATFQVTAAGGAPLAFQWSLNGTNLAGATSNVLVLASVQTNQAGVYSVLVTNSLGMVQSSNATLTVLFSPPIITQQPLSQSVPVNSNATFQVGVTGSPPLRFQWLLNGTNLPGATNNPLVLTTLKTNQSGPYSVIISNAFGAVQSADAILTVTFSAPIITQQPTNLAVPVGSNVTFRVTATGTPPLTYQWLRNGTNVAAATTSALSLTSVQTNQSGAYSVRITNVYGSILSSSALLTVTDSPPYAVTAPANQTVGVGGVASLSVRASGTLPFTYQWQFNGVDIAGATNSTMTLSRLRYDQSGYYHALVRNTLGEGSSPKALISVVQAVAWGPTPGSTPTNAPLGVTNLTTLAAYSQIAARKADGGLAVWFSPGSFFAALSLTNPLPFLPDAVAVAAGSNHCVFLRATGTVVAWGSNTAGQTNLPAGLSNVVAIAAGDAHSLALRANGTVAAWGSNGGGQTTVPATLSNVVAVAAGNGFSLALKADGTVTGWGNANGIVPAAVSNVIAVSAGGTRSQVLRADGTVLSWGADLALSNVWAGVGNIVAISGSSTSYLALRADGTALGGFTNPPPGLSNVIAIAQTPGFSAALIGDGSPAVTVPPANRLAVRGNTATFSVRAAGLQPVSYQWQFNGANLPGATGANLVLPNVQAGDIGAYRAVVANSLGSATSATALLSIPIPLPVALNATNLTWTNFTPATPWFGQILQTHDGDAAGQSAPMADNQQSIVQTTLAGPGTLSFWWKVSSEPSFDFLRFYLDDLNVPRQAISGEIDWQQVTIAIPAGNHTARWAYAKDQSVSVGRDAGWLDEVIFAAPPVITLQPLSQTVWFGSDVTFQSAASGVAPFAYQWLKAGTNLPGATQQSLTLSQVARRDTGAYALQASNPGGTVLSSNAQLIVLVPQQLAAPMVLPDGSILLASRDADGGTLTAADLARFEAQASTNLADWTTLTNSLSLTNGVLLLHEPTGVNYPARYYRLLEHY